MYTQRDEIAGQLALHFYEAHELRKSAIYALMAAKFEESRYSWFEAEKWCDFGLTALEKLPLDNEAKSLRLDLLEHSGYGNRFSGQYSQADQRYREALTFAKELKVDAERIASICDNLAELCEFEGRLTEATAFVSQGKQILEEHSILLSGTQIKLDLTAALIQESLGNYELAVRSLRALLINIENLSKEVRLDYIHAEAYNLLGIALGHLNYYSEAVDAYQKAIEFTNNYEDKWLEAACLLNAAEKYFYIGKIDDSLSALEKGLKLALQIGDLDSVAYAHTIKGGVLLFLGRPKEAMNKLDEALSISLQIGSLWNMAIIYADMAMAHFNQFDLEKAYECAVRGLAYAEEKSLRKFSLGYVLDALAQVETARKDLPAASQHFERAILIHQQIGDRHFAARAQSHFAKALLEQGDVQKASELLQSALATLKELKLTHEIEMNTQLLDKINGNFAA